LSGILLASVLFSLFLGRYDISLKEFFDILFSKITGIEAYWPTVKENIIFRVRIPRVLIAGLVGMSLSVAGTCYQCIFKNPMAAPDLLGASTGAAFGAALAILSRVSSETITVWAFIASILCVVLVLVCSRLCKGNQILNLVLSGILMGSLFQAATSYLKLIADPHNDLPAITYWLMGSLSGATLEKLEYIWIIMAVALIPIFILRWKMNLLTLEDYEAQTMGINAKRIRVIVIICSTLLTAASVSVSGIIGWIGLVVPHMARKMVGNDCRSLVPISALTGAIFLILVDDLARNLHTTELPLGILTAFVGVPFFIFLLSHKGGVSS
jgi:iron complex transport system permease protein